MKCETCDKEINGIEVFGDIGHERCFACWMDGATPGPAGPPSGATKYVHENYGVTKECERCKGTGEYTYANGDVKQCFRCSGYGMVTGDVCEKCEGTGEIAHECDCELCSKDYEDCGRCHSGLVWRPEKSKRPLGDYKTVFVASVDQVIDLVLAERRVAVPDRSVVNETV
jgi:hypothetical protein